jgi:hypothetical protein
MVFTKPTLAQEAKAVVLRAALDEMSDYVERVAGARRTQRLNRVDVSGGTAVALEHGVQSYA